MTSATLGRTMSAAIQPERALLATSVLIAGHIAPIPGVLAISAISLAELQFGVLTASDHVHTSAAAGAPAPIAERLRMATRKIWQYKELAVQR